VPFSRRETSTDHPLLMAPEVGEHMEGPGDLMKQSMSSSGAAEQSCVLPPLPPGQRLIEEGPGLCPTVGKQVSQDSNPLWSQDP
jgi:hypothetical protein